MLEKPDLADDRIVACLQADFGLPVDSVTFLALGADVDTAVYRADAADGSSYFVKLRRGEFDAASVEVPRHLSNLGVSQVIAPIPTRRQELWARLAAFTVTLYPFVDGEDGFNKRLSSQQWFDLGTVLRKLHAVKLPAGSVSNVPRETWSEHWRELVRDFQARVERETFPDPSAAGLAATLRQQRSTVDIIVRRAEELAREVSQCSLDYVLCHGDIHAGNVQIDRSGTLFVVDWDTLCLAPKERDLMYIGAGIGDTWNTPQEEDLFYQGYGASEVDHDIIAYYRYERIVQDIVAFAEQLLLTDEGGDDREQALYFFNSQFQTNGVVEIALRSDPLTQGSRRYVWFQ